VKQSTLLKLLCLPDCITIQGEAARSADMILTRIIQSLSELLTIALIVRIFFLRLHDVYRVFSLFLIFDVFTTSVAFLELILHNKTLDYRITFIATKLVEWSIWLWMVYALLKAILAKLPGILGFAQKVLAFVVPAAVIIAVAIARPELSASGVAGPATRIAKAIALTEVLDRVIATVALLVLLAMLLFILWFPVQMPRNLALLSVGYVIYFAAETVFLLFHNFRYRDMNSSMTAFISNATSMVLIACLVYWLAFLNSEGEISPVRMGHSWRAEEQSRLIGQLEAMNAALVRAARR